MVVDREGQFRFDPVFTFYLFTNFQVIFVSSDRSESEMLQYMQVNKVNGIHDQFDPSPISWDPGPINA